MVRGVGPLGQISKHLCSKPYISMAIMHNLYLTHKGQLVQTDLVYSQ